MRRFCGPDSEDNYAQALLRKQRSEIVATSTSALAGNNITKVLVIYSDNTFHCLFRQTRKNSRKIQISMNEIVRLHTPAPPMLVLTKQQPLRKTRPSVPPSELVYHPYAPRGPTNPAALPKAKICPVLDVESSERKPRSSRRQRRKKLKDSTRQRSSPRFWRPSPSWSGSCRGYAYGYPTSFGDGLETYQRDRMKKATCDPLCFGS